jgi:glycosyltransferase involved in cell wall biosynthesis
MYWEGPLLDCSGYAAAGRGYVWALDKAGVVVRAVDKSRSVNLRGKGIDKSVKEMYSRLFANKVGDGCPLVQHQVPDVIRPRQGRFPNVVYTIFEMRTVPPAWVDCVKAFDLMLTGSGYSKAAFVNTGVPEEMISVVPHVIDTDFYKPDGPKWAISNLRGYNFVALFDFTPRKGWRDLLSAYWNAFSSADDVSLTLKVYYGTMDVAGMRRIAERIEALKVEQGRGKTPPVLLYGYDISALDMPAFYRSFDCFVQVSREGFGLPFAEAMACGLLTIGPEVGGNREYMDSSNSLLVKCTGWAKLDQETVLANAGFDGIEWPMYSANHLAHLMRRAYEDRFQGKVLASAGMESVRQLLSWERIAAMIVDACRKVGVLP